MPPRAAQLLERRLRHDGRPVKVERVHALLQDGRERGAQHGARELQQRGGHHLHHQVPLVAQHQAQHGGHHRGLAGAHDELPHHGAAALQRAAELLNHVHLRREQHNVPHELEHQVPRVERQRRLLHKVPPRSQVLGQLAQLLPHADAQTLRQVVRRVQLAHHLAQAAAAAEHAVQLPNARAVADGQHRQRQQLLRHARGHERVHARQIGRRLARQQSADQEVHRQPRLHAGHARQRELVRVAQAMPGGQALHRRARTCARARAVVPRRVAQRHRVRPPTDGRERALQVAQVLAAPVQHGRVQLVQQRQLALRSHLQVRQVFRQRQHAGPVHHGLVVLEVLLQPRRDLLGHRRARLGVRRHVERHLERHALLRRLLPRAHEPRQVQTAQR
mmetsp:Transcript_10517/g.33439  ORF Transcript_10517/g.33439 Transcript_10517/m.33439 type:complete len:390 (+) Transcript_10517:1934-3103(+)